MRKAILSIVAAAFLAGAGALLWDRYVARSSEEAIYRSLEALPHRRCALLLGTNKYLARGKENWYYRYRIEAAAKLYRAGKVDRILVSGDGRSPYYDETGRMRRDLLRLGVPPARLISDPVGLRTLASLRRAKERFACADPIVVSQAFHLERALFLARALGMDKALGYAAAGKEATAAALRMRIREILARGKMLWDLARLRWQGTRKRDLLHKGRAE